MSQRYRETLNDFTGGYNSRDQASLLRKNESPDMLNIVVGKRGTIKPRPGTALFRDDPVSDPLEVGAQNPPVTSLYEYVTKAGVAHFFAFAGESLKKASATGWDLLEDGFTAHSLLQFVTHPIEDVALFVNGANGYWETDGSAGNTEPVEQYKTLYEGEVNTNTTAVVRTDGDDFQADWAGEIILINSVAYTVASVTDDDNLVLTGSAGVQTGVDYSYMTEEGIELGNSYIPTRPRYIEYYQYRVWLANVEGFPDRVYFNIDDLEGNTLYNYFTHWSWIRAGNTKGEAITGIKSFRNTLFVFTPTTLKAITGTNIVDFVMTDVSNTVGSVSQRSIHVVNNTLIFLGVDGVYMFDGQSAPFKVSQRLEPTFKEIRQTYWRQACGIAYDNKYLLSLPLTYGGGS